MEAGKIEKRKSHSVQLKGSDRVRNQIENNPEVTFILSKSNEMPKS